MPCARTNQKSNSTLNIFEKETTVLHVTTIKVGNTEFNWFIYEALTYSM